MSKSKRWDERLKNMIYIKEQANEFLYEKEDEIFEDYRNLIINEKYSVNKAKKKIIEKYNITNSYLIEKLNREKWGEWTKKIQLEKLEKEKLEKEKLKNSKICSKCGEENGITSNFCINCGNKL